MNGLSHLRTRTVEFLRQDIWEMDLHNSGWLPRQVVKAVRIALLTVRGFRHDELPLRASGLTFTTLLSLAPLLAFVFLIYKGLGRGREMIDNIKVGIADMPEQVEAMVLNIIAYVENSSSVGLGGFAVVILLYMVIRMMSSIEYSFNKVWGITAHRPIVRKITDYISTLVLVPMLIMAAGAITGFRAMDFWINQPESVHLIYGRLLFFGPMFAAWFAFTILYIFMPNTKVPIGPATVSGLIASFLWLVWHKFYIWSQAWLLARQDKVFGAFASIPMFMVWLYFCWIIVLFGAELAFAIQRFDTFAREHRASEASSESRILLTFSVLMEMGRNLLSGGRTFDTEVYAKEHSVPIRLLNEVMGLLHEAGLAGELADHEEQYILLRAPDRIKAEDVVNLLICEGASPDSLGVGSLEAIAAETWRAAHAGMAGALEQQSILDLIRGEAEAPA